MEKDFIFEYNYSLSKDNIKNAEKVYNKAINRKSPVKFILFGIAAAVFIFDYIRTHNIAFLYMALLCMGFIAVILLNNSVGFRIRGIYDIICSEQYNFKLCSQKLILKTIQQNRSNPDNLDEQEEIQPTVIDFSQDSISIYEQDMQFVLVDRENAMFYAFPKDKLMSEDIGRIKSAFKQSMGERFIEV